MSGANGYSSSVLRARAELIAQQQMVPAVGEPTGLLEDVSSPGRHDVQGEPAMPVNFGHETPPVFSVQAIVDNAILRRNALEQEILVLEEKKEELRVLRVIIETAQEALKK